MALKKKKLTRTENEVIKATIQATTVAAELFGAQADIDAEDEIYEYLKFADEAQFMADMKETIIKVKEVRKVETPSPAQVFQLFDRIWNDDDEDYEVDHDE